MSNKKVCIMSDEYYPYYFMEEDEDSLNEVPIEIFNKYQEMKKLQDEIFPILSEINEVSKDLSDISHAIANLKSDYNQNLPRLENEYKEILNEAIKKGIINK